MEIGGGGGGGGPRPSTDIAVTASTSGGSILDDERLGMSSQFLLFDFPGGGGGSPSFPLPVDGCGGSISDGSPVSA